MTSLPGFVPWPDAVAAEYRARGYWTGQPIDDVLRQRGVDAADRVAVVCGERRVAYRALDERVDRRAAALAQHGIGRGDRVVVQLPNVLELVEALFALFRLGAIPVMALPSHRRSEIAQFVTQARAVAYVAADRFAGFDYRLLAHELRALPETPLRHVFIVGEAEAPFARWSDLDAAPRPLPPVDASSVALLQLSGGSTGTPKLIARTHDDYLFSVRTSVPLCGLGPESVYMVALPGAHNFPLSSAGILGAMVAGARLVMCPRPHPDVAFPLLQREAVTITAVVPPLARAWLSAVLARGSRFPQLRVLQIGGAKLSRDLAIDVMAGFGCRVQQVFGMAEGLVNYTRLDDSLDLIAGTQGRPMTPADEVRIVDDQDRDVPDGEVGHLLARGPYTIRGYFDAADHDAHAFTPDGFYRTGDRVKRLPSGHLVVEGRAKEQINRGGEKVAPVEIEQLLARHPAVEEAAVVGITDWMMGERICAVLVPRSGHTVRRPDVMSFLRSMAIADFKLPDRVEVVPSLPRTPVGKIDKRALAETFAATDGPGGAS